MTAQGYHIAGGTIVNEGETFPADLFIAGEHILKIVKAGEVYTPPASIVFEKIDASGRLVFPGAIDDQVHFREPGLTHKGDLFSESSAAAAGGITSYMEMPNTKPQAVSIELLEEKYKLGAARSVVNYAFFMGATNDNLEEILKTDLSQVPGLKIFMGSSTGNMLVDKRETLEAIFRQFPGIIALHCEDEATILANMEEARLRFGENVPPSYHPIIRSEQACYLSSSLAVELAEKYGTRIHVLHISTAAETHLFRNDLPLAEKKITAEACIHHLWFAEEDYARKGNRIKWNPAVKSSLDRTAIMEAVIDGRIDVVATDHAPHTKEEKAQPYFDCPSGGPMVQHALPAMLEFVKAGKFDYPFVAQKMAHNPAILFRVKDRGFIREGYFADIVLVNPEDAWEVKAENLLYKCGWSPMEGVVFSHKITETFVNGNCVYRNQQVNTAIRGKRLLFNPS